MLFGRKAIEFEKSVRSALAGAREEAARVGHDYVGCEHLLLSLTRPEGEEAARLFGALAVDVEEMRDDLVAALPPRSRAAGREEHELPYTSRSKKVLETAMREAHRRDERYVEVKHLLVGLVKEERSIAAQLLAVFGVTEARIYASAEGADLPSALRVVIDDASDRPIAEQIVSQVKEGAATGALRSGERLPTVRRLAERLDVAPGTVARAYGELERLGIVTTEGTRGTRIAARERPAISDVDRPATLAGLLRPVVVASYHLGASASELRMALTAAMRDIYKGSGNGA